MVGLFGQIFLDSFESNNEGERIWETERELGTSIKELVLPHI